MWLTLLFCLISSGTADPNDYTFTIELNPTEQTYLYDYTIMKHLPITYTYYPKLGHYIQCVSNLVVLCGTDEYYWALYINGKKSPVGVDQLVVKNGDQILLRYTQIHKEEAVSSPKSSPGLPPGTHLYIITLPHDTAMFLYDYSILKHLPWKYIDDPKYGHYIQCVNNLCGNSQYYWAIWFNGVYAQEGVDSLSVKNGDRVELRYTPIQTQPVEKKAEPRAAKVVLEHTYLIHLHHGTSTTLYNYSILKHLPFQYKLDPTYGHFLTCVKHICGNSDYYWAIYLNGEYAQFGVDQLIVKNGDKVGLIYTKINSKPDPSHHHPDL